MSRTVETDFRSERDQVVTYMHHHLIGPLNKADEEVVGNPLDRYLLGVLYPQNANVGEVEQDEENEASAAGGEENEIENPISMAFEYLPASMGISFYVKGTERIQCRIWGGVYHPIEKEKEKEQTSQRWKRESLAEPVSPEIIELTQPLPHEPGKRIHVLKSRVSLHSVWRPLGQGFLVTVTMLNQKVADKGRPRADECIFQAGFSCSGCDGRISDYPQLAELRHDPEEEELSLLYRERRLYAVGHGCAASWQGSEENLTVSTSAMPVHETFPVSRDLADDDAGKSKDKDKDKEKDSNSDIFSLEWLADEKVPVKSLCRALRKFVSRYGQWIESMATQTSSLPAIHQTAARRIMGRLHTASERMNRGIDRLEKDKSVTRAFRLATRAMLMQMIHSGSNYGGATRQRDEQTFQTPAYSGPEVNHLRWYPFQLAFQLLTLESVVDPSVPEREVMDLIWFPTGGGKTEAYLWVAALEMFLRRMRHGDKGAGTAVIKRYTLRLLTSQQFQRAATLICACERLRAENKDLGASPFTLGLWIGGESTANTFEDAKAQYEDLIENTRPENPFQLQRCPWCGTRIVPEDQENDPGYYGVRAQDTSFQFYCPTASCPFHEQLPVAVVDEELFQRPPSMLIGTIDKFARLAWDQRSSVFFGGDCLPPGLVIQDELHLISGPLGTIAGIYEAAIDCLLTREGYRPKIIAATATIRRASDQAKRLYARQVAVFPPSGLSADDSYFARTDYAAAGRLYVGVMGQGHTPVTSLVRTTAVACQAPQELSALSDPAKDGYWTTLIYHNSKRELGKTMALSRDDIPARIKFLAKDESNLRQIDNVEELSANIPGRQIPEVLHQLEKKRGENAIDILPCTNMISVGVDVKRLGIMVVMGQPKTTAEYIQATSRVGRDRVPGLVITMYSPTKPRDRSHYEGFRAYHEAVYRWVEPTSVTPFALPSRERALHAALVILARHAAGLQGNNSAQQFDPAAEPMKSLIEILIHRMSLAEPAEAKNTERHMHRLVSHWARRAEKARSNASGPLHYNGTSGNQVESLLCSFEKQTPEAWPTLNSMRHVDGETLIHVHGEKFT